MDTVSQIETTTSTTPTGGQSDGPAQDDVSAQRTSSNASSNSTASAHRDKTRTIRAKRPSRQASGLRTPPSATMEDKSLTSFPSLSPPADSPFRSKKNAGSAHASLAKIAAEAKKSSSSAKNNTEQKPARSMVAALTAKSPSAQDRYSLFEDSPATATQTIPGALHYASDSHIQRLVARPGAVKLVRQLAEDLARREAEMSSLRRRAELRERELKKMLREVEVSNMDIESRLHALDQASSKNGEAGKRSSIGQMVEEAIDGDISAEDSIFGHSASREELDKQATIRAKIIRAADNASVGSQDTGESKAPSRGWKDYIWSGTATKRSSRTQSMASSDEQALAKQSGTGLKRKGLDDTLFRSPESEQDSANDKSRATSVGAWTMKLFAGNPTSTRDTTAAINRGRANTNTGTGSVSSKGFRNASQASTKTNDSSGLRKVESRSSRRSVPSLNFGSNSAVKSSAASGSHVSISSPSTENPSNNLGPVEMDAILPHGLRPPTLTPSYHNIDNPDDLLTDRFGFIYDQRRRKKEAEALARVQDSQGDAVQESINQAETQPGRAESEDNDVTADKTWQDHLKTPSRPTELLSHTPSTTATMTLSNPAIQRSLRRISTFENIKQHGPSSTPSPLPATIAAPAFNAEIASPVMAAPRTPITSSKADFEPVKALLSQLTELHDNLQREKTIKWNEFLRKVRTERRKEEETAAAETKNKIVTMPEASLTDGETIGIATLGNKGKVGRAKYREFKGLVLSGIPVVFRAKVWNECSGASTLRIPGYYADLVASGEGDPIIISQIQMDINRTLTDNVFFRRGPGVEKLSEVLLAYSRRNVEVGYCQGMNLITASLLLIMPAAEDAFWMLVTIIENILPRHYFDNSLLTSRADQQVLKQYVSELLPKLSHHLTNLSIDLEALTFQWFLSLFTACLNAEALYRVWDVLLCCKNEETNGGSTFLFQVSLALLKLNETQLIALESPGEVYAYLGGEITNHAISIDGLIRASEGLKTHVRRVDVESRREKCVALEMEVLKQREALERGGGYLHVRLPLPVDD